jgi:hypothetical protein
MMEMWSRYAPQKAFGATRPPLVRKCQVARNILVIIFVASLFCYSLYHAYEVWFQPNKYLHKDIRSSEFEKRVSDFFRPVFDTNYWGKHPKLDLSLARVNSILFIIIGLIILLGVLINSF